MKEKWIEKIPEGDDRKRKVCAHCSFINYVNPKIVSGVLIEKDDQILLCKRAIEPRYGYWTLPAGYLEVRESPEEGAIREAKEEAGVLIEVDECLGIYTVRRASQIHFFYRAHMLSDKMEAGIESLEVKFFKKDEIPWDELSFRTVKQALKDHLEIGRDLVGAPRVKTF